MNGNPDSPALTNGSGAAAILSATLGCFVLAILAILGDHPTFIKRSLVFYTPTGPLSGVTTIAILVWLFTWAILHLSWAKKTVPIRRISALAFALLTLSLLLTFPPISDLF